MLHLTLGINACGKKKGGKEIQRKLELVEL